MTEAERAAARDAYLAEVQQRNPGLRRWVTFEPSGPNVVVITFDLDRSEREPASVVYISAALWQALTDRFPIAQAMTFPALSAAENVRMAETGELPPGFRVAP